MGRGIRKRKVVLTIELAPNTYSIEKLRRKGNLELYIRLYGMTYDRLPIEQVQANVVRERRNGE